MVERLTVDQLVTGSIPVPRNLHRCGNALLLVLNYFARLAQLAEHTAVNRRVIGSIPIPSANNSKI